MCACHPPDKIQTPFLHNNRRMYNAVRPLPRHSFFCLAPCFEVCIVMASAWRKQLGCRSTQRTRRLQAPEREFGVARLRGDGIERIHILQRRRYFGAKSIVFHVLQRKAVLVALAQVHRFTQLSSSTYANDSSCRTDAPDRCACRGRSTHLPAALLGGTSFGSSRKAGRCDPASLHTPTQRGRSNERGAGGGKGAGQATKACAILATLDIS